MVVHFLPALEVVPADPEVEGQRGCHFDVVLKVGRIPELVRLAMQRRQANGRGGHVAEQKINEPVAGVSPAGGAAEVEGPARRQRLDEHVITAHDGTAGSQRMLTLDDG